MQGGNEPQHNHILTKPKKKAIGSGVEVWQRLKGSGFYNCIPFYGCPAALDRTIEQDVGEWGDGL